MGLPVFASIVGGLMANSAAKKQANAINKANEQNNQYLNAAMPYIEDQLGSVSDMYKGMIEKGPYTGEYYAGPNTMQRPEPNEPSWWLC
jgi:ABC-type oligopeptide transport system substrate-binding subunit